MSRFFKEPKKDIPSVLEITQQDFLTYKDNWMLYRGLGTYSSEGVWQPPISFLEAMQLPRKMLETFFQLDELLAIMQKQRSG